MPISEAGPEPGYPAGTVVVVPFPYSDRLAEKRRPAVVVSAPSVARAGYVWIAMITSLRNPPLAGDVPIVDGAATGLSVASVVRPLKIACIDPSRVLRAIGTLDAETADEVYDRVRGSIGTA